MTTRRMAVALLALALSVEAQAQSKKISELPSGSPAASGDMIPVVRAGVNLRVDAADFCIADSCTIPSSAFPLLAPEGDFSAPAYGFASGGTAGLLHSTSITFLQGGNGSGADQAGESLQINPGKGTGTGAGGTFIVAVAPPSTTGSSANSLQNILQMSGSNGNIVMGGINVLAPAAQSTYTGSHAATGTTNTAGSGVSIRGGAGTGSGNGGNVALSVAPAGSSGMSQNSQQTGVLIAGSNGSVTIGGISVATPGANTLQGTNATGSNTAGGSVTVVGGAATSGSANGGEVTLDGGAGVGSGIKGFVRSIGRTFATLGTPSNGSFTYCSDCVVAHPCAGSGSGAVAWRLNGAWVCDAFAGGTVANSIMLGSAGQYSWSSNADPTLAAADTGLARVAAGFVKASDGGSGFGRFRAHDGSVSSVSYGFNTDGDDTGFWLNGNGNLVASTANVARWQLNSAAMRIQSSIQVNWSSGDPTSAGADVGLARSAVGVLRVANGSTGLGYLQWGSNVVANTGTATPGVADSRNLYTNTGDADGSTVTLPNDPTIGTCFDFAVRVNQNLTIAPSTGESIQDAGTNGTTSSVSNTVGSTMRVCAITNGSGAVWQVMFKTGTWTTT